MKRMILLLAVVSLVAAACASGVDSSSTSVPETLTTTSTTVPETTTTTAAVTTTTAVATTTTTTVAPTTTAPVTTTTAAATIELSDEGLQAGGVWVYFGFDDAAAIAAVSAVVGSPTIDTGWVADSICPAPTRTVRWNDLWLLFTKGDTDFQTGGVPHFFAFYYSGPNPTILTTKGIGLNSTVANLKTAYSGPKFSLTESPFVPGEGSWSYDLQTWTGLWGYTSGLNPTDTVIAINGGRGCGE